VSHADNGRLVDSYDRPVSQYGASFGSGSDAQASLPQFTLTLSQEVSQDRYTRSFTSAARSA